MATIKFLLRSKSNPANIYLRLSLERNNVFKRKTGYTIDPNKWSLKKGYPKQGDEENKRLKILLDTLKVGIEKRLNDAAKEGIEITGDWLQEQIDTIQGKKKKEDIDRLVNYIQYFIDNIQYKEYSNGKQGVSKRTVQKYNTLKNKVVGFEQHMKKQYFVKNVNTLFRNDFIKYLEKIEHLNTNTIGKYIKNLKSVCYDAQMKGYEVSSQLKELKGFTEKVPKIYLSFDELEKIENTTFERQALRNAKDWLLIGCYIGQRVSDLLHLTSNNIKVRNGLELIELTQKKTGKRVAIPLHVKVKEILDKNGGEFPEPISAVKFNLHLKDVCELAEITEPIKGSKMVEISEGIHRKIPGVYPKCKLITSHVCRRSFATNFYGEIPTALLISITAHSTEKQFLEYIGKTSNDYAVQIAEYFHKETLKAKHESPMTVLKKAN